MTTRKKATELGEADQSNALEPEALYSVELNGVAEYLGTPLSPMHNPHVVKGKVVEAIRDKIETFELA